MWAAVLVAACVLTYANGLTGGFTYDDKAIVRDNPRIRAPESFPKIFTTSYFGTPRGSGSVYRPVLLVSYAVQWWVHGREAIAFHAVNVLLHAGATLLLAALLVQTGIAPAAVFASSLLFAVHPIHVEAVTSLVGRGEVLAAVFALLYLRLALRYFQGGRFRLATLAAAFLCYALSVLTKESGSSAPAVAFLLFVYAADGRLRDRLRAAFVRGFPVLLVSAAAIGGVLLLRRWVLGGFLKSPGAGVFEVENALAHVGAWARAVNACVIFFRYVGRFVFPLHLSADESAWSIEVAPIASPVAIGAVALLAALTAAALWRLASRSPVSLGFLFFCLALLPASNLLFPIGTIFAERVAYLPIAGLCLAAGALLAGGAGSLGALAGSRRKILAAVALVLAARSVVRNAVWWSDEGLFLNLVRTAPDSAKAHYDIAYIWAGERQYKRALEEYTEATEIYDEYWDAWAGKGRMESELGLPDEAEESYKKAIASNADYENGYFGLGLAREARGDLAGAGEIYREGLAHKKDSIPLAYRLALARSRLCWPAERKGLSGGPCGPPGPLADWRKAVELGPTTPSVHAEFASWLARSGQWDEAAKEARQALRFEPGSQQALRLLAERGAHTGRPFAEALAREKIYRLSRSRENWALLLGAAEKSPAYARRFAELKLAAPAPGKPGAGRPASRASLGGVVR